MVSLREFLNASSLQDQLQTRLAEECSNEGQPLASGLLVTEKVKDIITSFIQVALENYIVQVYVAGQDFETPEELQETIEEIAYHLSPEAKGKIVESCTDEEAYRLGRTFYNLSKKQLPC